VASEISVYVYYNVTVSSGSTPTGTLTFEQSVRSRDNPVLGNALLI